MSKQQRSPVCELSYHVVWCVKYRRPVLVGAVADDLHVLLREKADKLHVKIKFWEIMPDYVQLYISAPATEAPHRLANQFKGYSSRMLRLKYPQLRSRLPSLWSRSYYMGTVGQISTTDIMNYIEGQKRSSG